MPAKTLTGVFEGFERVSSNAAYTNWNSFVKIKLPPFAKVVNYVMQPEITSFNPSGKWYGVYNSCFEHNALDVSNVSVFPMCLVEKDGLLYMPLMGELADNMDYGDEVEFWGSVPYISAIGALTTDTPIMGLTWEESGTTFLYYMLDNEQPGQGISPTIGVIADDQTLNVGDTLYFQDDISETITLIEHKKLSGINPTNESGIFLQNTADEAVDCMVVYFGQDGLPLIRLKDVGKLKWQIKTVG